jgi:hypothetical protein
VRSSNCQKIEATLIADVHGMVKHICTEGGLMLVNA